MWHKPCRTFHPWCPCIKTRCLSLYRFPITVLLLLFVQYRGWANYIIWGLRIFWINIRDRALASWCEVFFSWFTHFSQARSMYSLNAMATFSTSLKHRMFFINSEWEGSAMLSFRAVFIKGNSDFVRDFVHTYLMHAVHQLLWWCFLY